MIACFQLILTVEIDVPVDSDLESAEKLAYDRIYSEKLPQLMALYGWQIEEAMLLETKDGTQT